MKNQQKEIIEIEQLNAAKIKQPIKNHEDIKKKIEF